MFDCLQALPFDIEKGELMTESFCGLVVFDAAYYLHSRGGQGNGMQEANKNVQQEVRIFLLNMIQLRFR